MIRPGRGTESPGGWPRGRKEATSAHRTACGTRAAAGPAIQSAPSAAKLVGSLQRSSPRWSKNACRFLVPGDFVGADAAQAGEPVSRRFRHASEPGNDGADRAPGDPHQSGDRGFRTRRREPGDLVVEEPDVCGAMPGPRHRRGDHPVHRAPYPRRLGFQIRAHCAQVQRLPAAPTLPIVIRRTLSSADSVPSRVAASSEHFIGRGIATGVRSARCETRHKRLETVPRA